MPTAAPSLFAHFLPSLVTPDELAGGDVVVIDVLRASTTIVHALAAGAECVVPCAEVAEAREAARRFARDAVALGGERGGLPISGFDLGNSPTEYTKASVAGKTIVFTTTNGTAALNQCKAAQRVLIGSFVNLTAVGCELRGGRPVHLLCAGTRGRITREDVLCAGAIGELFLSTVGETTVNDQARIAVDAWRFALTPGARSPQAVDGALIATLRETEGGRNLASIGLAADIDTAAQVDRFDIVPRLDVAAWRIVMP
jgi:2-phosphosulfolactate phosphatase